MAVDIVMQMMNGLSFEMIFIKFLRVTWQASGLQLIVKWLEMRAPKSARLKVMPVASLSLATAAMRQMGREPLQAQCLQVPGLPSVLGWAEWCYYWGPRYCWRLPLVSITCFAAATNG